MYIGFPWICISSIWQTLKTAGKQPGMPIINVTKAMLVLDMKRIKEDFTVMVILVIRLQSPL